MIQIEKIAVSKINPADYNPRIDLKPGDPEYQKLLGSINEFDCVKPLVWNKRTGNLVGGHQRFKILKGRGDKEIPCAVVELSLEKEKALNLALNKISGNWDCDKLAGLLDEMLNLPEFDINLTGFDLPEASKIIDQILYPALDDEFGYDIDPDNVHEPETQPGDIIKLGQHRVICGDSREPETFKRLFGDKKANLCFTDPPYAVDYRGGAVGKDCTKGKLSEYEQHWDDLNEEEYSQLLSDVLQNIRDFTDNNSALYIWFASSKIDKIIKALKESKWQRRNLIIWGKNTFAGSLFAQYKHQYEPCYYCHKKGRSPRWQGPNNETTLWQCDKPSHNKEHPTIKPIVLALRAIRNSSYKDNIVLDPFLGSGTTLIAADRLGRICYGIERDRRYCELIKKRYQRETTLLSGEKCNV